MIPYVGILVTTFFASSFPAVTPGQTREKIAEQLSGSSQRRETVKTLFYSVVGPRRIRNKTRHGQPIGSLQQFYRSL